MQLSEGIRQKLRCPASGSKLRVHEDHLICEDDTNIRYPIIEGIPVLIDDSKSLFSISDFKEGYKTTLDLNPSILKRIRRKYLPRITANVKAKQNYTELAEMLSDHSKVLVIGGGSKGEGMDALYNKTTIEIVESDVSFGEYTKLICDSHDIPFADQTFDCVIIQAVLEHVLNPERCVQEIHRVLKYSGLVYAETAFMQQVHMGKYDFTRFTHLGHRWLFRGFDEIKSGPCCGPGTSVAWAHRYFLKSLFDSKQISKIATVFGEITSFFWKYFDYYLIDKPGAFDAASGLFFFGKKNKKPIEQHALIEQYKGIGML